MSRICAECGDAFPSQIKIENKQRNLAKRKRCLHCSPFGSHNTRRLNGPVARGVCRDCGRNYQYRSGKAMGSSTCGSCVIRKRRLSLKTRAVGLLGGSCRGCGYSRCDQALDFHHVKSDNKEFGISGNIRSWARVQAELVKCILVCKNCHTEIHAGVRVIPS